MITANFSGQRIAIVGAGSNIGRQLAHRLSGACAALVLGGPNEAALRETAQGLPGNPQLAGVDITDESSIDAFARSAGDVDHVVTLAGLPANGPLTSLDQAAITRAFSAKVIGPLLLAKHFGRQIRPEGSMVLFSGFAAWRPSKDRAVMATANGAVAFLAAALAIDLAPIRVNAVSPGIVDSGAWDRLGDSKPQFLDQAAAQSPIGRVGVPDNIADAVIYAMANSFVNGTVLHADGGSRLV